MTVADSLETDGIEVGFRYKCFKTFDHGYGGGSDGGWAAVCVWPWGFSREAAFEVRLVLGTGLSMQTDVVHK